MHAHIQPDTRKLSRYYVSYVGDERVWKLPGGPRLPAFHTGSVVCLCRKLRHGDVATIPPVHQHRRWADAMSTRYGVWRRHANACINIDCIGSDSLAIYMVFRFTEQSSPWFSANCVNRDQKKKKKKRKEKKKEKVKKLTGYSPIHVCIYNVGHWRYHKALPPHRVVRKHYTC